MKKWIAILLTLALLLTMAACGGKEEPTPEKPGDTEPEASDGDNGKTEQPGDTEPEEEPEEEPAVEETVSPYPGRLPLGGETAEGQRITIPDEGTLVYLGSKVATGDYEAPVLLSFFRYTKEGEYSNSAAWGMTVYADQNGETLWTGSCTYNDVALDDSFYEEIEPGDEIEVCMIHDLANLYHPVVLGITDSFEDMERVELTVDLTEVEFCLTIPEDAAGYYGVSYLYADGNEWEYDQLAANGMADNSYLELYADGTGVLSVAGSAVPLYYDADYCYIGETRLYLTLDEGTAVLEGDDLYYEFVLGEIPADEPGEEEEESFEGKTVFTPEGYVSITLSKGWYVGEPRSNDALTLYPEGGDLTDWVEIIDLQLTSLENEMKYTQTALPDIEYEEITIGDNTYYMLFDEDWPPQTFLVAETSTGYAFTVEVRGILPEEVMEMLESIVIH